MITANEANKISNNDFSEVSKKLDEYFDYQVNLNVLLGNDSFIVDVWEIMDYVGSNRNEVLILTSQLLIDNGYRVWIIYDYKGNKLEVSWGNVCGYDVDNKQ